MDSAVDDSALFIRNIPSSLSASDKQELFQLFSPVRTEIIGKESARLEFLSISGARNALQELHQVVLLGQRLSVKYARKRNGNVQPVDQRMTDCEPMKCPETVLDLLNLGKGHKLDFRAPPPPDLKYKYPGIITPAIIRNISLALQRNPAFYTQVLHLMNKMNLPPPWIVPDPDSNAIYDRACQTEEYVHHVKNPDLATDESELESESESILGSINQRKRRANIRPAVNPKRFRSFIAMEKKMRRKSTVEGTIKENSDLCEETVFSKSVPEIMIPPTIKPVTIKSDIIPGPITRIESPPDFAPENNSQSEVNDSSSKIITETINQKVPLLKSKAAAIQISIDQLKKENPIFRNYDPGTPSHILYIKNLAKSVTQQDLDFFRCYATNPDTVFVDLKTTGRLRGQAFVTFAELAQKRVDEALRDTNGALLKDKPMYVCYSKSGSSIKDQQQQSQEKNK